ncbi:MAG: AMP-dependent synthetase and ligase [Ilumatobacteraceae bacterium]|nr:AMP-dependent synthetase and ligase [Ilumatobacteraceae bacterium]
MIIEPRPLGSSLDDAVVAHGDRVALRMGSDTWTYDEFADLVDRCAAHLAARGVTQGSRVGLSAGNSPEFVAVVFATLRLGATIVMVSTAWRDREVAHALALTEPTHLVHDGSGAAALDQLVTDRPVIAIAELQSSVAGAEQRPIRIDVDDLAVMVFSSGTTGLPKAVRHTHRTMFAGTRHWVEALGLTADDRLQIATPPFHILGLLNLFAVIAAGASVRLHRRFDLDTVLTAVEQDRITIEMAVAPIALAMASHPDLERFDLSSLRYIMWGATPVTASVADTVTRRSGVRFLPAYGASELPVIAVNPEDRPDAWRLDSVGVAPHGVELRAVDIETGAVLAPGGTGELQVRSPSLMIGYLPETANDDVIVDGWYRTGDVGAVDAGGWVTITDRVKEMIKVNGFQVAPAEIEGVLLGHPDVVDCAVFGVPHAATGEAVVAAVVRAPGSRVDADALREIVAANLAAYKRVSEVQFLDQIPRLPSGKVLRRELQASHGS